MSILSRMAAHLQCAAHLESVEHLTHEHALTLPTSSVKCIREQLRLCAGLRWWGGRLWSLLKFPKP
jgi:hypothetical protein